MRRFVCVIGALVVTAGAAGASTVSSGLRGTVVAISGGACLQDSDCGKRPVADTMLVFSAAGATKRTMTDDDGSYRVLLAPGTYRVKAMGSGLQGRVAPSIASVQRGRMKTVDFVLVAPHVP